MPNSFTIKQGEYFEAMISSKDIDLKAKTFKSDLSINGQKSASLVFAINGESVSMKLDGAVTKAMQVGTHKADVFMYSGSMPTCVGQIEINVEKTTTEL